MEREVFYPNSGESGDAWRSRWLELRGRDITSSQVAALFNMCPYMTLFELWHIKKGTYQERDINSVRIRGGTKMERAACEFVMEETGLADRKIYDKNEYIRLPKYRLGSSFDFEFKDPNELIEQKMVDTFIHQRDWEGRESAPPHIELQCQLEMLVSGIPKIHISVLVGGNTPFRIERTPIKSVAVKIIQKSQEFWKSIEENRPPPDNGLKDRVILEHLFEKRRQRDVVVEPSESILKQLYMDEVLKDKIKAMTKKRDQIKLDVRRFANESRASLVANETVEVKLKPWGVKWSSR